MIADEDAPLVLVQCVKEREVIKFKTEKIFIDLYTTISTLFRDNAYRTRSRRTLEDLLKIVQSGQYNQIRETAGSFDADDHNNLKTKNL